MPTKKKTKAVVVREHLRRVPISKKNPTGKTVVDQHLRYVEGQYLDLNSIDQVFRSYDKKKILYPAKGKLLLPNEDKFDEYIAVWVDYFNKKLSLKLPLEILHDLNGESKDFVFKDILKKDLKDPNISIALGTRWLAYKKQYADKILKRTATSDEVIQVYKGILNDKSETAIDIMKKYRKFYGKLKTK